MTERMSPREVAEAENRLARFNSERDRIIATVKRRVVDAHVSAAEDDPECSLEYVLNEVAFAEIKRYEKSHGKEAKKKLSKWKDLALRLGRMSESEKRRELEQLVGWHAQDIAGNFNPKVYRFANDIIPSALSFLLAPISSVREGLDALGGLGRQVQVEGALDLVRAAADSGTLVFAPTHTSNLDSIVLGFGLSRVGLPPVTYGAGKNLFSNPLISYFMQNLGAYRVDRRLRFGLYKEVLKEYSTVLLERGFHSLFFPGGTRCRSGRVEQRLKLGLLGTSLAAFGNTQIEGISNRRIFIVPVTINYRLVLEAETLVEDYLAETGKSRYIIEDDEFSRIGRVLEFARKLLAHGSSVIIRVGQPMDVFGNRVNDDLDSLDHAGRILDSRSLLWNANDEVSRDAQRDAVYTRRTGRALAQAFRRETVFLSTHLVCRSVMDEVVRRTQITDLYKLLRVPTSAVKIDVTATLKGIDRLRERLIESPQWGQLDSALTERSAEQVLDDGLRSLSTYHTRAVLTRVGDSIRIGYGKLLFYYQNRMSHIPSESEPPQRDNSGRAQ